MPSLEVDGWELENVEEAHTRNPQTFHIPSKEERSRLKVGDLVRLIFLFALKDETGPNIQGERMRLTLLYAEEGFYIGLLDDAPVLSTVLRAGDFVLFEPENVATLYSRANPSAPLLVLSDEEWTYVDSILQRISNYQSELQNFGRRSTEPVSRQMAELEAGAQILDIEARTMRVPSRFRQFHVAYANATQHFIQAISLLKRSMAAQDTELLAQANTGMGQGLDTFKVYQSILAAFKVASSES